MNVYEYQKEYLKSLFTITDFEFGYYTSCGDPEFYFGNTIFCSQLSEEVIAKIIELLVQGVNVCEVQFEIENVEFCDDFSTLYLLGYNKMEHSLKNNLTLQKVSYENFECFKQLSEKLQIEEYGKLFKQNTIANCLNLENCEFWMLYKDDIPVGEFEYFPQLKTVESIVIAKEYRKQGIGTDLLHLIGKQITDKYFLSADNDTIEFYQKNNFTIYDQKPVSHLYGNLKNLIMFLSLLLEDS